MYSPIIYRRLSVRTADRLRPRSDPADAVSVAPGPTRVALWTYLLPTPEPFLGRTNVCCRRTAAAASYVRSAPTLEGWPLAVDCPCDADRDRRFRSARSAVSSAKSWARWSAIYLGSVDSSIHRPAPGSDERGTRRPPAACAIAPIGSTPISIGRSTQAIPDTVS